MNSNRICRSTKRPAGVSVRLKSLRSATNEHFDNEPYDLAHDLAMIEAAADEKVLTMEDSTASVKAFASKEKQRTGDFHLHISVIALLTVLTTSLVSLLFLLVFISAFGGGNTWVYSSLAPAVIAATTAARSAIHRTGSRAPRSVLRAFIQLLNDHWSDSRRNDRV